MGEIPDYILDHISEKDQAMAGIPSAQESTPQTNGNPEHNKNSVDTEKVLEGQGLEEVVKNGWDKYREILMDQSYGEIVRRQMTQIKELEQQPQNVMPEWIVQERNYEAAQRARDLAMTLPQQYGRGGESSFFAHSGDKKLMIQGKEISLDQQGHPTELPVTRFYFTVSSSTAPEAFQTVLNALNNEGVTNKVNLALNLETYYEGNYSKQFENNTIILYAYGKNPELMSGIVKAVQDAKNTPNIWGLPPGQMAKAKEETMKDFMIPLDDNVSFAEMPNNNSYHADVRGKAFHEITGDTPYSKMLLEEFVQKVGQWTPNRPGVFEDTSLSQRRRYMPALLQKT